MNSLHWPRLLLWATVASPVLSLTLAGDERPHIAKGLSVVVYLLSLIFGLSLVAAWRSSSRRMLAAGTLVALSGLIYLAGVERQGGGVASKLFVVVPWAALAFLIITLPSGRNQAGAALIAAAVTLGVGALHDVAADLGALDGAPWLSMTLAHAVVVTAVVLIHDRLTRFIIDRQLSSSLVVANADLSESVAIEQRAVRRKSEFLANVSHELRTQLDSILNIPDGLLADFEDKEGGVVYRGEPTRTAKFLRVMASAGTRLLALVDNILDLSRLEAGKMTLQQQPLTLDWLVDAALRGGVSEAAKERRITLEVEVATPQAKLRADPAQGIRILVSLLDNALRATSDGGRVMLRASLAGANAVFSVSDQGPGVPEDQQEQIFDGFGRIDNNQRTAGGGLGLAIAKRLVELHGGRLELQSQTTQGNVFTATLPAHGVEAR